MGIREIRATMESCKHCFMCRHACPTFLATKLDSHTPRGYALLLSEIDHGRQGWAASIVERFYQCSQCGLCKEDCAFHWAEDEVVRNAREEIVAGNLAPERVKTIAASIAQNHSPYVDKPRGQSPTSAPPDRAGAEILYFAGCSTRHSHPSIVAAVGKLMAALNADWTGMSDEGCCGVPLFDLGYTKEAAVAAGELAQKVLALKPRLLLTGCPHCYRAFRELYPAWGVSLPRGLAVMHTSQYFEQQLSQGVLKIKRNADIPRACYHDPCQLGRKMGEYDAPRKLVAAALGSPPRELFHSREKAECCGAGSSMFLTDPALARRVAGKRIEKMREVDAGTVITACQNCRTGFLDAAAGSKPALQVLDIVELMARVV